MTEGDNGRVTLAVLGTKLDEVLRRLERFETCNADHEKRLSTIEQVSYRREEQIANLREDVQAVKQRDVFGSITTGLIGGIAGLIAWFK